MNEFFATLWDIFAVIGIACIATTLGGLFVFWRAGRSEAKRWAELQAEQERELGPNHRIITAAHAIREKYLLDRTDAPYTLPVNGRRF